MSGKKLALVVEMPEYYLPTALCYEPKMDSTGVNFVIGFTIIGTVLCSLVLLFLLFKNTAIKNWQHHTAPIRRWLLYILGVVSWLLVVSVPLVILGIWLANDVLDYSYTSCL